jgi:hypothetical protein
MNTVTPVTITTPDGVERELRFTLGARKRIHEIFGFGFQEALDKYDSGAFPGILYALMHDSTGKPPEVTIEWLAENLPADSSNEILASIMSAGSQGKASPKEIEALLAQAQQAAADAERLKRIGSTSGPSVRSASESAQTTSGGVSANANLKPALNGSNVRMAATPRKKAQTQPIVG